MLVIHVIYLSVVTIVFFSSLTSFRRGRPIHLRILSLLLGCTVIVEIIAAFVRFRLGASNLWLYNISTLITFIAYAAYYFYLIKLPRIQMLIKWFFVGYPIIWGMSTLSFGLFRYNSYSLLVGSVFVVVLSIMYYYQLITEKELVKLHRHAEFWIASGMILFHGSYLPFSSLLSYLLELPASFSSMRNVLVVTYILSIVMYTTFLYGFVCKMITRKY